MEKKIRVKLEKIVSKGLEGSTKKQDQIFNSSMKNRKIFKHAKLLAKF